MKLLRIVASAALALALLSSCGVVDNSKDSAGAGVIQSFASNPGQPTVPKGVLLGLSSYPVDYGTIAQRNANWQSRTAQAGRPYDIANFFYAWNLPFPTAEQTTAIANGTTPMISWNGTDTGAITSGSLDALIRTRAQGLRDLHVPVFLRFFWEMDGKKGTQLAGGNPANYVAAWRHVHDIFQQEGATNVAWVWAPTNLRFGGTNPSGPSWYPGDDVVDWIGCDGYNWSPVYSGYNYDSFRTIFSDWYGWAAGHNKPLMVAETGVMEKNPGDKAAWFRDMVTTLKTSFTNIRAVVYYDISGDGSPGTFQWKVDTADDSLVTWQSVAKDSYLNTRNR